MNLYLWDFVDHVSDSYHSGGGLVVIAESEEAARQMANATSGVILSADEAVTYSCPVEANIATVWVFPNAGCC